MNAPLECIVQKYEKSTVDWKKGMSGKRSVIFREQDFKETGKRDFMNQLRELEMEGLVKVKWYQYGIEAEKAWYSLEQMETIYQRLGKIPKFKRIDKLKEEVDQQLALIQSQWIRSYYQSFLQSLDKGDVPKALDTPKRELLFTCFKAIDCLQEPVYKRIFSKKYLGKSKAFEKHLQSKVLSAARAYLDTVNDDMDDRQVLDQLMINGYAQELAVKGNLIIELAGNKINLSLFPSGFVFNNQTLRSASIPPEQFISKVITVENKANYESMPYEEGTLIIYSHGYFSPDERAFLIQLERVLSGIHTSCGTAYLHTGDLDYGGVKIFQYIKKRIFPKLYPYLMDTQTYDQYMAYGEPIETSKLEKLQRTAEPLLQPLIDKICAEKQVIEQESFLF